MRNEDSWGIYFVCTSSPSLFKGISDVLILNQCTIYLLCGPYSYCASRNGCKYKLYPTLHSSINLSSFRRRNNAISDNSLPPRYIELSQWVPRTEPEELGPTDPIIIGEPNCSRRSPSVYSMRRCTSCLRMSQLGSHRSFS